MLAFLNSTNVNILINTVLALLVFAVAWNVHYDLKRDYLEEGKHFFYFVLFYALYLLLLVLRFATRGISDHQMVFSIINCLRVLCMFLMYRNVGMFVVVLVSKSVTVHRVLSFILEYGAFLLCPAAFVLYFLFGNISIANIPIVIFYLAIFVLILCYRKSIGSKDTVILLIYLLPSMLLSIQKVWSYTPANIYASLILIFLYGQIWKRRQEELLQKEEIFAGQKAELADAKIALATLQMNPHFTFNALTSIAALCERDPSLARKTTMEFAEYMRGNVNALSAVKMIPFQHEMDYIEHYVFIEKIRYSSEIEMRYELGITDFELPPMTVQPLVENAIKYGIVPKGGGYILVKTYKKDNSICIDVVDNGLGFDPSLRKRDGRKHVGLENVRSRLRLLCCGTVDIQSVIGEGTSIHIELLHE